MGRIHEDDARREYIKYMESKSHIDFKVQSSGLVINPSYPFIGASPDGVFTGSCCGEGLLEIKCPFKYRDVSPISNDALRDKNYFLQRYTAGEIHLKSSHTYYHQVQGQMAVKQLPFCDFVCWTQKGLFVEQIQEEKDYVSKYMPNLRRFFLKYLLPELLTHKYDPANSNSVIQVACSTSTVSTNGNTDTNADPSSKSPTSSKLYCFCQRYFPGKMVACDNPTCTIEWYHYSCVGVKCAPRGKWFCPDCQK